MSEHVQLLPTSVESKPTGLMAFTRGSQPKTEVDPELMRKLNRITELFDGLVIPPTFLEHVESELSSCFDAIVGRSTTMSAVQGVYLLKPCLQVWDVFMWGHSSGFEPSATMDFDEWIHGFNDRMLLLRSRINFNFVRLFKGDEDEWENLRRVAVELDDERGKSPDGISASRAKRRAAKLFSAYDKLRKQLIDLHFEMRWILATLPPSHPDPKLNKVLSDLLSDSFLATFENWPMRQRELMRAHLQILKHSVDESGAPKIPAASPTSNEPTQIPVLVPEPQKVSIKGQSPPKSGQVDGVLSNEELVFAAERITPQAYKILKHLSQHQKAFADDLPCWRDPLEVDEKSQNDAFRRANIEYEKLRPDIKVHIECNPNRLVQLKRDSIVSATNKATKVPTSL